MTVRRNPCAACGTPHSIEAHHEGPRGLGQKTSDWLAVPLCTRCHATRHANPAVDTGFAERLYEWQIRSFLRIIEEYGECRWSSDAESPPVCALCGCWGISQAFGAVYIPVCGACARDEDLVSGMFTFDRKIYEACGPQFSRREGQVSAYLRTIRRFVLASVASDADRVLGHRALRSS